MADVRLTVEEYLALLEQIRNNPRVNEKVKTVAKELTKTAKKKTTRKANTAYSRAFAKVKGRYMKKSGGWKKDGFARAVRAAHRMARK